MSYTKVVGWGPFRLPGESARRKAIEDAVAAVPRQEPAAPETPAATETPEPQAAPATGPKHAAAPAEEQDTAAPRQSNLILDSSLNWHMPEDYAELTLPENFASLVAVVPKPDRSAGILRAVHESTRLGPEQIRRLKHLRDMADVHLTEVVKQVSQKLPITEIQVKNVQSAVSEYQRASNVHLKVLWADKLLEATRKPVRHTPLFEASTELWKTVRDIERASNPVRARLGIVHQDPKPTSPSRPAIPPLTDGDRRTMQVNLQRQFDALHEFFALFVTVKGPELRSSVVVDLVKIFERLHLGSVRDMRKTVTDLKAKLFRRELGEEAFDMQNQVDQVHLQLLFLETLVAEEEARATPDTPKTDDDAETNDPSETRPGGRR